MHLPAGFLDRSLENFSRGEVLLMMLLDAYHAKGSRPTGTEKMLKTTRCISRSFSSAELSAASWNEAWRVGRPLEKGLEAPLKSSLGKPGRTGQKGSAALSDREHFDMGGRPSGYRNGYRSQIF